MNIKSLTKTLGVLFVSVNLAGLGVALFILSNIGSDTVTVFVDGLSRVLGISLGNSSLLFNASVVVLGYLSSRKDVGFTSVVFSLSMGFAIDFYLGILGPLNIGTLNILSHVILVLLAQLCFGITYALLIKFGSGMNPLDAIAYGISRKLNTTYRVSRTGMDVVLISLGFIMGGVVGLGSIISVLSTGTLVSLFVKLFTSTNKQPETAL